MKILVSIGISISLLTTGYYFFAKTTKQRNGYCFSEKRYLTNAEILDTAIDRLLENLKAEYSQLNEEEKTRRTIYSSRDDFYQRQPHCCGREETKLSRPPKPVRAWIKDKFIHNIYYQYKIDNDEKYRKVRIATSFCGDISYVVSPTDKDKWRIGEETNYKPSHLF